MPAGTLPGALAPLRRASDTSPVPSTSEGAPVDSPDAECAPPLARRLALWDGRGQLRLQPAGCRRRIGGLCGAPSDIPPVKRRRVPSADARASGFFLLLNVARVGEHSWMAEFALLAAAFAGASPPSGSAQQFPAGLPGSAVKACRPALWPSAGCLRSRGRPCYGGERGRESRRACLPLWQPRSPASRVDP